MIAEHGKEQHVIVKRLQLGLRNEQIITAVRQLHRAGSVGVERVQKNQGTGRALHFPSADGHHHFTGHNIQQFIIGMGVKGMGNGLLAVLDLKSHMLT
jgi:hypothetical protein